MAGGCLGAAGCRGGRIVMSKKKAFIKLQDIERIELYINEDRLSLAEIVESKRPDLAMEGTFYTGRWAAACHLKSGGYVYANDDSYEAYGYAWDKGPDINMFLLPDGEGAKKANYITCCQLIGDGLPFQKLYYNVDVGGSRGRGCMAIRGNELVFLACTDGADSMTPEELQAEMVSMGCDSAVMMDGGGKVNFYCRSSEDMIQGQDNSQNLILIYLKKEESGLDITQRIMTKNGCYTNQLPRNKNAAMLHSTGAPGATAADIIDRWNTPEAGASVEFVIDDTGIFQTLPLGIKSWHCGESANNTHVACEICEPIQTRVLAANWKTLSKGGQDNTVYAVTLLQKELVARGYDPKGIDGVFGPGCDAALRTFQKDQKLAVDGYCGKATLKALQGREGSFLIYPAEEVQVYFENVYQKAVTLFSWLMTQIGGNPEEILCHSEGYRAGIASNHADVLHWFPSHGKSMDDFRADVAAAMEPQLTLEDAVDKLAGAGIITAPEYWKSGIYSVENVIALIIKFARSF